MTNNLISLGRCFICGNLIYDSFIDRESTVETEEGHAHKECIKKMKAQEKSNLILDFGA